MPTGGSIQATLRVDAHADIGEGPTWDADSGCLLWVDILGRCVHRFNPADGTDTLVLATTEDVGAAIPRRKGGFVVAWGTGFGLFDPGATTPSTVIDVEADQIENRMNDGKCDPGGRLWAGTMAYTERAGAGSVYRLDPDMRVTKVIGGVTISNGLGWSPDERTMYYIDTATGGVDSFDFNISSGSITNRRRLIDIPSSAGAPDGMTVDAEGGLWVALWGGGAVRRYWPDGSLDMTVTLPCRLVTSCAFAGPRLDELFITTATHGLTAEDLADQPGAGGLFSCRPGHRGLPATAFAG